MAWNQYTKNSVILAINNTPIFEFVINNTNLTTMSSLKYKQHNSIQCKNPPFSVLTTEFIKYYYNNFLEHEENKMAHAQNISL
jgi:hypothetical protein